MARDNPSATRRYNDNRTTFYKYWLMPDCEHCDGENAGYLVRLDSLRGWVCPCCDSALDEMFDDDDTSEAQP